MPEAPAHLQRGIRLNGTDPFDMEIQCGTASANKFHFGMAHGLERSGFREEGRWHYRVVVSLFSRERARSLT